MNHAYMRQLSVSPLAQFSLKCIARAQRLLTFPRSRLRLKLVVILTVTTLLSMVLSSFLVLSFQRQQLIDQARSDAVQVEAVIEASLFHTMSDSDTAMLKTMIGVETSQAGLDYIRILDQDGTIWNSSNPGEIGRAYQRSESPCSGCHVTESNAVIPVANTNSQIIGESLVTVNMLANEPSCHACHSSSASHLGLLMVATPLTDLRAQLAASSWWLLFSGLISFILLVGLLTPALEKFVTRPIIDLAKGTVEISAGNLDYTCHVKSDDELGDLATTFDAMRRQIKAMLDAKEEQNHELRTLNDIVHITSELLDPQQILDFTVRAAVTSLGVEAGAIRLVDREHGLSILHACVGMPACDHRNCDLRANNIALSEPQSAESARDSLSLSTEDKAINIQADAQGRSYVGISLEAKGVRVGGLTLITHPGQSLTEEGKRTLKAVGQQIGLAALNAIHFRQARNDATLEERDRLAREMHDSLAQALGYLKLKTAIADELLSGGQIDQARLSLREVKQIAGETYFDVRETIFGLRNTSPRGLEFLPGLEEYLGKYRLHYGLQVHLVAEENCSPSFSPETNLQLTRIIQEALVNVRKHANSNEAAIRIAREDHHWLITVEDHGAGFDARETKSEGWRFLGLHIMQERAEAIGADLRVDSQPGSGTHVMISVPFESEV